MTTRTKRTVFFTMVRDLSGKWMRVGKAYSSRDVASSWLPFVRGAYPGFQTRVSQCTVCAKDGKVCEESRRVLSLKYNMDA